MYDLRPLIKDIKKIVDRHYLGEPGKYARWITQDAKNSRDLGAIPYGCANAANILYTIGELPTDFAEREAFVKVLQDVQNKHNGLFENPGNFATHTTAFVSGALNLLDELYYINIEPIVIFYSISSAYVDMYRAFCCKAEGKNPEAMGDAFGLGKRGFVLSRAAGNLRRFDKRKLDISLDAIVKTERELKSYSGNDRAAIEKLIVRLIYIMKTGEALD